MIITDNMVQEALDAYGKFSGKTKAELKQPEYQRAALLALKNDEAALRLATVIRARYNKVDKKKVVEMQPNGVA